MMETVLKNSLLLQCLRSLLLIIWITWRRDFLNLCTKTLVRIRHIWIKPKQYFQRCQWSEDTPLRKMWNPSFHRFKTLKVRVYLKDKDYRNQLTQIEHWCLMRSKRNSSRSLWLKRNTELTLMSSSE